MIWSHWPAICPGITLPRWNWGRLGRDHKSKADPRAVLVTPADEGFPKSSNTCVPGNSSGT